MLQFDISIKSLAAQGAEICRFFKRQLTCISVTIKSNHYSVLSQQKCLHFFPFNFVIQEKLQKLVITVKFMITLYNIHRFEIEDTRKCLLK